LVVLPSARALGGKDFQPRHIVFSLCSGRFVLTDFVERRLVVRLSRFHLRFGLSKPGASILDRDHVVGGIDIGQKLPFPDRLSVDHIDVYDGAVDPGTDQNDMTIDLRVVGVFIRRQIVPCRYCDGSADKKQDR
jgi:hypothetical protein